MLADRTRIMRIALISMPAAAVSDAQEAGALARQNRRGAFGQSSALIDLLVSLRGVVYVCVRLFVCRLSC